MADVTEGEQESQCKHRNLKQIKKVIERHIRELTQTEEHEKVIY